MPIQRINRKKGIIYRARFYDMHGRQLSKCFNRLVDASRWEVEMKAKIQSGILASIRKSIKFEELAKHFIEHSKSNLSYGAWQRYESSIRIYFLPVFSGWELSKIRRFHIEQFKSTLNGKKSASTIFTILKTIFNKAIEWEYLESNPAARIRPPKKNPSLENYWSEKEITKFLHAMKGSQRLPLYLIALNTGMRAGEILGLKWDSIDFERGWIHVRRSFCQKTKVIRETTKTNDFRIIPINPSLRKLLSELRLSSQDERIIQSESLGIDPTHTAMALKRDAKKANVRVIRFHDLRHTFASQYVAKGGNIFNLCKILGHKDIKMTMRYSHFAPEYHEKLAEVVSFDVPVPENVIPIRQI